MSSRVFEMLEFRRQWIVNNKGLVVLCVRAAMVSIYGIWLAGFQV